MGAVGKVGQVSLYVLIVSNGLRTDNRGLVVYLKGIKGTNPNNSFTNMLDFLASAPTYEIPNMQDDGIP
jgi:hypothetical protein